jgi:hypothetical protein
MAKRRAFLSYAASDRAWVTKFARALEERGFEPWWDQTIQPGEAWDRSLQKALEESEFVIVLLGVDQDATRWQAFEIGAAAMMKKPIIAVAPTRKEQARLERAPSYLPLKRWVTRMSPERTADEVLSAGNIPVTEPG